MYSPLDYLTILTPIVAWLGRRAATSAESRLVADDSELALRLV